MDRTNKVQVIGTKPAKHPFPIISWLIRLVEWSKQSHVTWYFPDRKLMRHAYFNEIKEQNDEEFFNKHQIVRIKDLYLSDEEYAALDLFTKNSIGEQSGYFSTLVGSLIPLLIRNLTTLRISNPFTKGITCSEFIRKGLEAINPFLTKQLTGHIKDGTFTTDEALYHSEVFSNQNNKKFIFSFQ